MRRAKIVCTLGPATATPAVIHDLIKAGLDVARLNMSHGSHEVHAASYAMVRQAAQELNKGVGILADLQGPKIRLETFADGPVEIFKGDKFTITTRDVPGDKNICGTTFKGLAGDCKVGDPLLIDDGRVELRVTNVSATDVETEVVIGGPLSDHKGINLPGVAVSVPALSQKDEDDLRWAIRQGVDIIALSFVRNADDIRDVHRIMDEEGTRLPVIAKIEKPQAVANLEAVINAFDGVMVARGDLGVELPLEQVPLVQKEAITMARALGKPVIVATQMLDSMITNARPTRAEVSDVANAVLDGADALMLSGETSIGFDPVHTVATMARIVEHVEIESFGKLPVLKDDHSDSTARAISEAAVWVAQHVHAGGIVVFTETGRSAKLVARHRPEISILVFSPNPQIRNQLALVWGTETFLVAPVLHTDDMVDQIDRVLLDTGRLEKNEKVVLTAGVPPGVPGTTNGMRVHQLGRGAENLPG